MANEAVILELLGADKGQPVRYTVADGTAITKGTLMQVSGGNFTAIATAGSGDSFVGIAAADKVANDGATEIAVYTEGIFDLTCANTDILLGETVVVSGANLIRTAVAGDLLRGGRVGVALEAGTGSEVIRVHVQR